ncbi:hypothetical protein EDD28_0968 [Salana multivorans]|uniref:ABC3 transporter permease C-terminal domain-containing protein n=1 Tax=Salana multivorans TaxID=120377 RepID=A0A3N2D9B9_9MICO|nr:FtsX-like permease family protein [Salana multivorans]MBN8883826.1 hypothetical protein [Salana multivorans]OJX97283.1 MAG: hypothetical protein BGO96_04885 [Micrococcales bacterium 73-15]ROR96385.1 hypothetical protein EDD28_0968 [Salana multivorans]
MSTLRLWALLRRRSRRDSRDPASLTSTLAVIAFAATTAVTLVVLGGLLAFIDRARAGVGSASYDGWVYVNFAVFAVILLLVPLSTLGGAAARLAMARRDARLATMRLVGATTTQVTLLTLLDAAVQALIGAAIGIGLYGALLPLVARLSFQDRTFDLAELWVGVPNVLLTVAGVLVIALVSAASSLQRVAVTPLGVATRQSPPALTWLRGLSVVVVVAAIVVVNQFAGAAGMVVIFVLMGFIGIGMFTLNLVGPWLLSLVARMVASRTRKVSTLLAARRVIDSPKTGWRSVGGVAIATFVAGVTSIIAIVPESMASSPDEAVFLRDIGTGGLLTLGIAGILAGVSTGVMQAGRVIDQRQEYANLVLAGTPRATLDGARFRETLIPLLTAVGTATVAILIFLVPILGMSAFAQPGVVLRYALSILAACALVLLGGAATRVVAHRMTAQAA